ncbi:MAG: VOC family protein, partial [Candidatus Ornithomonoglobus sp.]
MTIDHIAIYVSDLEKSRAFYEKYFAAKANDLYCNSAGLRTYFLS